jgi:hypothetical protein
MKEDDGNTFAQMLLLQTDVKFDVHICHDRFPPKSYNKGSQTHWPYQYIKCCTSIYYIHILNTKKIYSNVNSLNIFTKEIDSSSVKPILIR